MRTTLQDFISSQQSTSGTCTPLTSTTRIHPVYRKTPYHIPKIQQNNQNISSVIQQQLKEMFNEGPIRHTNKKCYNCQTYGHTAHQCPLKNNDNSSSSRSLPITT
uniref:CCHC-type domain-containing protein n=1 Tax=Meloidogyne javanica TaxID=6303 RepID=A0A915MHD0_MELJA